MDMKAKMAEKVKKDAEKKFGGHPELIKKIERAEELKAAGQIIEIELKNILDDKTFQMRSEEIKKEDFESLRSSIKKHGMRTPIFVRKSLNGENKYQMLAGFNRLRAHKELGLKTIKAIYNDNVDDEEAANISEAENLIRTQMSFFDMLCYINKLKERGIMIKDIAERLDKGRRIIEMYGQVGGNEKLTKLIKEDIVTFSDAVKLIKLPPDQLNKKIAQLEKFESKAEAKKTVSKSTAKPACVINEAKGTIRIAINGTIRGKESILKELKKAIVEIEKIEK
jgi:ParB/RepB/Spo0J family partition protein